jgi:N-acetylglucosamine kinase-like BadF-type ATPase
MPVAAAWGEDLAAVTRKVAAAAREGDPVERDILGRAADTLAELVRETAASAGIDAPFEVRVAGGLGVGSELLQRALEVELERRVPLARLGEPITDPLGGALQIATRAAENESDVPPGW